MSKPIDQFLQQFKDEEILYFPNPGNAGDSVIATATYQVLDRLGLRYATPRFGRCDLKDRVVVYGGGGNLVGPQTFSARFVAAAHVQARRLVILPHTVKNVTPLLEAFGDNVDIICREAVSYDYVSKTVRRARAHLMDDMAFNMDVRDVLAAEFAKPHVRRLVEFLVAKPFSGKSVPGLDDVLRSLRLEAIRDELRDRESKPELYCFRTDGEKTDIPIPASNIDLSEAFRFGVETKAAARLSAHAVLTYLSKFKLIHTNRLHMAISGALLGLDVNFHSNDYYKCRAVYEQSMLGRFDNVRWAG